MRVPLAWNHASDKDSLKIKNLEHALIEKPLSTFPGHGLGEDAPAGLAIFSAPEKRAPQFCDWLIAKGASTVTSTKHDYVFRADNALWRKLAARIGQSGARSMSVEESRDA